MADVVEFLVLLQVRLHDAQPHAVDELRRRVRKPQRAVAGERSEQQRRRARAAASGRRVSAAIVGEHGRAREDRDREKRQAPDADQRRALRQHQRPGERVAERVPGKAGEQMAAQPFGDGERDRERENRASAPRVQIRRASARPSAV